jgi:hypothetical protein
MKKIIILITICYSLQCNAQTSIGKTSIDGSGILDFALNLKGGIVLPRVTEMPTTAAAITNGTLLVNAVDSNAITVQMRQNNAWVNVTDALSMPNLDLNTTADTGNGVVIGSSSTNADGVLVLESVNKALILPKVSNINDYKNAIVGTMFYDLATKSLAVFDGNKWVLWK